MSFPVQISPGAFLAPAVDWLNTNFHGVFALVSRLIEALRYAVRVAVSRYDAVLGQTLTERADETHRRHISQMTALLST